MKNFSVLFALTFVIFACNKPIEKENNIVDKQTYTFSIKETDTLRMDRYNKTSIEGEKPCVIYVFGGGFKAGSRSSENYEKFFNFLLNKGYQVISIDYRLGLKEVQDPAAYPEALPRSISYAVEDLFDATNYIFANAKEWSIDTTMLVPCGSSAGAITVLHAAHSIANKEELSSKLPSNFNYAGIISLAGAIFSSTANLEWNQKPAPILLFHGDADRSVPFDKLEAMGLGFYGSKHISEQLSSIQSPHFFYEVKNADHEISNTPIQDNLNEIDTFLEQLVKEKKQFIINTQVEQTGKPELKKDLNLMDYINSNNQ